MFCLGFTLLRMPNEKLCFNLQDQILYLRVLRENIDCQRGFQLVESIKPNEGLLYLLEDDHQPGFWMKDVFQHLDLIFIDNQGHILELVQAKPHDVEVITPPANARFAIEVARGIAEQLNLIKGSKLPCEILKNFQGVCIGCAE